MRPCSNVQKWAKIVKNRQNVSFFCDFSSWTTLRHSGLRVSFFFLFAIFGRPNLSESFATHGFCCAQKPRKVSNEDFFRNLFMLEATCFAPCGFSKASEVSRDDFRGVLEGSEIALSEGTFCLSWRFLTKGPRVSEGFRFQAFRGVWERS